MSRSSLLQLLWLTLTLWLLTAASPACATQSSCGVPLVGVNESFPVSPALPASRPALHFLSSLAFDLYSCTLSFLNYSASHADWTSCFHAPEVNVMTCPQHCLRALQLSPANASVLGSLPYHADSSICLAAIHAGVVQSEQGGAVHIDRFFPQDWSGTQTQSLYPGSSALPTLRHGVQSLPAPNASLSSPAPLSSHSWSVRPRGLLPRQRQTAPFSPRFGHLHAWVWPELQLRVNWSLPWKQFLPYNTTSFNYSLHLIIGGRNLSHHLNDVWLFHSHAAAAWDDRYALNRHNSRNGRWYRLPDAPFSGRSDMSHHWIIDPRDRWYLAPSPYQHRRLVLLVLGGQTQDACNNPQLGVCSRDIWQLTIARNDTAASPETDLGLSFNWSLANSSLPAPARCGFSLITDRRLWNVLQSRVTGVCGGQLSYDDGSCAANITTLADCWYGRWPYAASVPDERWSAGADAPFGSRRSLVAEDAIVSTDESSEVNGWELDKSVTLTGGIQYLSHRFDAAANRSRMTAARLFSDAWSCTLLPDDVNECDWSYSFPFGRERHNNSQPASPSGSLPVPLVFAPPALYPLSRYMLSTRMGGATSAEAVAAWSSRPLQLDDAMPAGALRRSELLPNASLLLQPTVFRSRSLPEEVASSWAEIDASRSHLPMSWTLGEAELSSDADSSFNTGTHLLTCYTTDYQKTKARELFSSVDSSLNSSFDSRRLHHSMAGTWDTLVVSGGRSASLLFNDWLSFESPLCFWPEDASYAAELGPLRFVSRTASRQRVYERYWPAPGQRRTELITAELLGAFRAGEVIEAACAAGFHFSPPLLDAEAATLTCAANSLWVDTSIAGIRRCVRDELQCAWPMVDAGLAACTEPLPQLRSVRVVTAEAGVEQTPGNADAASVVDVQPLISLAGYMQTLQLVLDGDWLTAPLSVTVGSSDCLAVQLRNLSTHCEPPASPPSPSVCRQYGSRVMCILPNDFAVHSLPVTLTTGRGSRRRTIRSIRLTEGAQGREILTLSVAEPRITSLVSKLPGLCNSSSNNASLRDCSPLALLPVRLCGSGMGITYPSLGTAPAPVNVSYGLRAVDCSGWSAEAYAPYPCDSGDLQCWTPLSCADCSIEPLIGQSAALSVTRLLLSGEEATNDAQKRDAAAAPVVSFSTCPAGHVPARNESARPVESCVPCAAGSALASSSSTLQQQQQCRQCGPGHFANTSGQAECLPCPAGSFSSESGAENCTACLPSEWLLQTGGTGCQRCPPSAYKVQLDASVPPECLPCPDGAVCLDDGALVARPGAYLLIDQQSAVVSSIACSPAACVETNLSAVDATDCAGCQLVLSSRLPVKNQCGQHRRPAADDEQPNLLCAACMDGFTEMQGVCVSCPAPNYGLLAALLLAALLLLHCMHRLSYTRSTSAALSTLIYYWQMSLLFQLSEPWPSALSLLSVDLVGDARSTVVSASWDWCLLPLSDYGKIAFKLLSPVIAVALLALLLLIQLAVRHAVSRSSRPALITAYHACLPSSSYTDDPLSPSLLPPQPAHRFDAWLAPAREQQQAVLQAPLLQADCNAGRLEDEEEEEEERAEEAADDRVKPRAASSLLRRAMTVKALLTVPSLRTSDSVLSVLRDYGRTLVRLLLFSYNSLTAVTIAFFHLRPLGVYGWRLYVYPTVDPQSAAYRAMQPLMIALLVFAVVGAPLLLLAALLWLRHRRLIGQPEADAAAAADDDDDLLTAKGQLLQPAAAPPPLSVSSASASLPLLLPAAALLTETYQPRYWMMAVVNVVRRLLLIVIVTFVTSSVNTWLTACNTLLLLLHLLTWPYRRETDNSLEAWTLAGLAAQTTVLSAYPVYLQRPVAASVALRLLLLCPLLLLLCVHGLDRLRQRRLRRAEHLSLAVAPAAAAALAVASQPSAAQQQPLQRSSSHPSPPASRSLYARVLLGSGDGRSPLLRADTLSDEDDDKQAMHASQQEAAGLL